jgi:hypothetical protein
VRRSTALATAAIDTTKRVWAHLVHDFYWSQNALRRLRVGVRMKDEKPPPERVKLQPFEVIVAAVFARLRPDYEWWVTPNRPDGGVDFIGRGVFLNSKELGIDAAITIGGQCKKRERVGDVVGELSGSFSRMAVALDPTFFVAAFSATLTPKRVSEARAVLERAHQRHCHILDRDQVEGLIASHLSAAEPVIREAFSSEDADFVLEYFKSKDAATSMVHVKVLAPPSTLAGESFHVAMQITRNSLSDSSFRVRWTPQSGSPAAGALVTPVAADSESGFTLDFQAASSDDPFFAQQDLEFLMYAVGAHDMGRVSFHSTTASAKPLAVVDLPEVTVIENLRPRFYDVPYRVALDEIDRAFKKACLGKVSSVAVVGAGGAGKSRLCDEVGIDARRHGAQVISARQAHTMEFPQRIFANLLLGLAETADQSQEPANRVNDILRKLEPGLAARARPVIETLFDYAGKPGPVDDDQALLSVLAVLIAQRSRLEPLIIHLHDLHWCTFDVLETIDRLIWQLGHLTPRLISGAAYSGIRVLFLLEGRMHEFRQAGETGWSTRVFERFIERLGCPIAVCRAFLPDESAAFAARLFERAHSARRLLAKPLLELQQELIDRVHSAAGGNPFHMLEHVKLLQQHGILGQNPRTGFMYMMKPDFRHIPLPGTVFEAIAARWRYYREHDQKLAVLLWSAALVDDNLPSPLFRYLWSRLAPKVTQAEIESSEFLTVPRDDEGFQVSFRHENYFQTVRRLQVPETERRAVIDAYAEWFERAPRLSPSLRYAQARVALEAPNPDRQHVRKVLRAAHDAAHKRGDRSLSSRILATLLDGITWPAHEEAPLAANELARACDHEIELCDHLIRSGRPDVAFERIQRVQHVIDTRFRSQPSRTGTIVDTIRQDRFILLTMKAGILFHDRQPQEALLVTELAVRELDSLMAHLPEEKRQRWNSVMMEVLDSHSAAIALSGDLRRAVIEARKAAAIAESLVNEYPDAVEVVITFANILLSEAPEDSESLLERYAYLAERTSTSEGTRLRLSLNLAMARVVLGYREARPFVPNESRRLQMAQETLLAVFRRAHPLGRLADAAAAALLLGLISALRQKGDDVDWLSQAVAVAVRARQMETLWRAHINLAHSLHRSGQDAHDSAAAALELMEYSVSSDSDADRSPRFDLLSVPMAHAVRYLLLAGDEKAQKTFQRFPALRKLFRNIETGELKEDRDGRTCHEWLRVDNVDYVIF